MKGIFNKVIHGFLHVLAICLDRWKSRRQFGNAGNVLPITFHPEETGTFPQTFVDVNLCPNRRSASRIEQEILNDARCPFDLRFNCL